MSEISAYKQHCYDEASDATMRMQHSWYHMHQQFKVMVYSCQHQIKTSRDTEHG